MHMTRAWPWVSITLLLVGCKVGGDDLEHGTTDEAAAEALTKGVSFEGGELVEGLLPTSTTDEVSLVPVGGNALEPGESSLMSFDLAPGSADAIVALIQFGGADQHFEVVDPSLSARDVDGGLPDAGAAGGGKNDEPRRIRLKYTVERKVCAKLCDRVYELEVVQAVRLRDEEISKHAKAKLTLDCRGKGDHDECGKQDDTSVKPVPEQDAGTPAEIDAAQAEVPDASDEVDASVRGEDAAMASNDAGATLAPLDPTGVWVSDYDCGGGNAYWVVWKIAGSGTDYTIDDGINPPYTATLAGRTFTVTRNDASLGVTNGSLDFTDDDHFDGTFDEAGTPCTETGRRAPGLDVDTSGPLCNPGGAMNAPNCTDVCDAATSCSAPACNCAVASANMVCGARYTVWKNCLDAEQITTPVFACGGSGGFESTSCWAEWDVCLAGSGCM